MFFFSTGKSELDQVLGGGIASGSISCIRGNTASGKTILLESILSQTPCPVLHFLTEQEMPSYISMKKDYYTFMHTNKASEIKDKIISAWDNDFGGIIAIDGIDNIDLNEEFKNSLEYTRSLSTWLRWFISSSKESPKESNLDINICALIVTHRTRECEIEGKLMASSLSKAISCVFDQQMDTKIQQEENEIEITISKNRFIQPHQKYFLKLEKKEYKNECR